MTHLKISTLLTALALAVTGCSDDVASSPCEDEDGEGCSETTGGTTDETTDETTDDPTDDPTDPPPSCGDGVVDEGEECDDGEESEQCNADCTSAACGDGIINASAGESCDDGGESAECNDDCTAAACGDGIINASAEEECDDMGESQSCDADCTAVSCGDSTTNAAAGEACDDGGESAECNDDCTAAACGDGIINASAGEVCDDSNVDEFDGCSANCQSDESCGNLYLDLSTGETCDDGNEMAGDGCDACAAEPFQVCSSEVPVDIIDNMTVMSMIEPPFPYLVTDVDLAIDITHSSLDDLDVEVTHGATTVLIADNFDNQMGPGNACTGDDMFAILDDDANISLEAACVEPGPPAIDGRYAPAESLSAFNNADVSGSWTLSISDANEGELGALDRWCLNLNGFGVEPSRLYWATTNSSVWSVEVDGANPTEVVGGLQFNFVVATDPANGHIYYDHGATITRSDADGANP
ncbi:DUF4215 domain-containing protein, partial [Enhygromyxa salina]|uniref:DUF4215 domain-containing protein n=1 Tax=Enhygromyxa salina TaxID=215803 RepID=UPI0030B80AE3